MFCNVRGINEWNNLSNSEKADLNSRQGVRYPNLEEVIVADPETYILVPSGWKNNGRNSYEGKCCYERLL